MLPGVVIYHQVRDFGGSFGDKNLAKMAILGFLATSLPHKNAIKLGYWLQIALFWQKITNVRDFEQNWPGNTGGLSLYLQGNGTPKMAKIAVFVLSLNFQGWITTRQVCWFCKHVLGPLALLDHEDAGTNHRQKLLDEGVLYGYGHVLPRSLFPNWDL